MLNIITNGYVLPFISKPSLVRFPLIQSENKALQKDKALATYIQSILSKNAIERVENVKSLGFYSRLFLVPKPHQKWRPVIDLSGLNNQFHLKEHWRYPQLQPYLVRQRQQYVSGSSSGGTTSPRPFPSDQLSSERKEGGHIHYNQVFRSLSQGLGIGLPLRMLWVRSFLLSVYYVSRTYQGCH